MKRSIFIYAMCMPLLGIMLSCNKSGAPISNTRQTPPLPPDTLYVTASDWRPDVTIKGQYNCTLSAILNYSQADRVSVYIKGRERDLFIGPSGLEYMGGQLHAEIINADVKLVYQFFASYSPLPVYGLQLKIVFEK